jgi:hypothetical protein
MMLRITTLSYCAKKDIKHLYERSSYLHTSTHALPDEKLNLKTLVGATMFFATLRRYPKIITKSSMRQGAGEMCVRDDAHHHFVLTQKRPTSIGIKEMPASFFLFFTRTTSSLS